MGLFDKVKNILFDEEPDDDEIEKLPKRESKKSKKMGFKSEPEEDTIKEVKVPASEKKDDFDSFDFGNISRTKMREDEYVTPVETSIPVEPVRQRVQEVPQERTVDRSQFEQRMQMQQRPQVQPRSEQTVSKPVSRSKYELPPKKEVHREEKDYKKILNETNNSKIRKPFTVTPIISPVYGIIDKNYKPEEIVEKNKQEPTYEKVRERMIGPVSYSDQELPEPVKYETSDETLTDRLRRENKLKEEKKEEIVSHGVEEEFDTHEFDKIVEEEVPAKVTQEASVMEEIEETPSVDISDLIEESRSRNYDEEDYEEDKFYNEPSKVEFEEETSYEEPPRYEEAPSYKAESRNDEVKESLDDTIETDLFNLIDSMYNTDEKE